MELSRNFVEDVIYGWGAARRFLQDDPVRPDVWIAFALSPGEPQPLLFEPVFHVRPGDVSGELRAALSRHGVLARSRLTYNQSTLAATLTFEEVVRHVIPLNEWWAEGITKHLEKHDLTAVPHWQKLREDLGALNEGRKLVHYHPRVLALVRIAGLLAYAEKRPPPPRKRGKAPPDPLIAAYESDRNNLFLDRLAEAIEFGWKEMFGNQLPGAARTSATGGAGKRRQIYSINRDRPATMAVRRSALTIKADAARLLFDIKCGDITWAILDSGIDATHPAFCNHDDGGADPDPKAGRKEQRLARSRVLETYDFTRIRELLWAASEAGSADEALSRYDLPEAYATTFREDSDTFDELRDRLTRGRDIDWEVLRPILRVSHDGGYDEPTNPHGTHVAGILGANWPKDDDAPTDADVCGICPDIRLIDLRVCRADGSSDEFTIISALQFARYLNAYRDYMVVHGVNVSLSLKHDVSNFACGRTPVCEEAERLVSSGVVVVAAAGNNGYNRFQTTRGDPYEGYCAISITDPGNAESVITVGSTHRTEPHSYGVSFFSSRGPTGDGRIKPDLVAPGEKIDAPIPDDGYARFDGTSMAAPHVSGAAALLMARNIELVGEPRRVKEILCRTATDLGRERYFQGHGLVDVLRALQSV